MRTIRIFDGLLYSGFGLSEQAAVSLMVFIGKVARGIDTAWRVILIVPALIVLFWNGSAGLRENICSFAKEFFHNEFRESPADGAAWVIGLLIAMYVILSTYLYINTPNHAAPAFFSWWINWFISTMAR